MFVRDLDVMLDSLFSMRDTSPKWLRHVFLNPVYWIQPVVKPVVQLVWQPAVSCKQTSNRLSNRFSNTIQTVVQPVVKPGCTTGLATGCIHDTAVCQTGCQTVLITGWMFVYTIQPVVNPFWQPVWQEVVSCKRGFNLRRRRLRAFSRLLDIDVLKRIVSVVCALRTIATRCSRVWQTPRWRRCNEYLTRLLGLSWSCGHGIILVQHCRHFTGFLCVNVTHTSCASWCMDTRHAHLLDVVVRLVPLSALPARTHLRTARHTTDVIVAGLQSVLEKGSQNWTYNNCCGMLVI